MSSTAFVVLVVVLGVVALGAVLMITRSRSGNGRQPSPSPSSSPEADASGQPGVFELFHIIPLRFSNHPAIRFLVERGKFDFEHARNTLLLPVEQALADKLGISVYTDAPLPAYIEGVQGVLDRIWGSEDGVSARAGDEAAVDRIADRTYATIDTMKAGLVNGDLVADVKRP